MDCLLCEKSYPPEQIECPDCKINLQPVKPYSPHLSQVIRLGEELCAGQVDSSILQLAVKNLLKRLDRAEDDYFKHEATYSPDELKVLDEYLSNILEQSDFVRKTLEELIEASKIMDIKKIYTCLDKAKIGENFYLKAGKKLAELTEDEMIAIAKKKGIKID
ncbi:MAG: hypothetical protein ABRQ39_25635 [Candidatus Eremiobacterota bacterium]